MNHVYTLLIFLGVGGFLVFVAYFPMAFLFLIGFALAGILYYMIYMTIAESRERSETFNRRAKGWESDFNGD